MCLSFSHFSASGLAAGPPARDTCTGVGWLTLRKPSYHRRGRREEDGDGGGGGALTGSRGDCFAGLVALAEEWSVLDEDQGASGSAWHTRKAVIRFAELLRLKHMFQLTTAQDGRLCEVVIGRLRDPHPEVREAAGGAMRGVLGTVAYPGLVPHIERFTAMVMSGDEGSKKKRRKKKRGRVAAATITTDAAAAEGVSVALLNTSEAASSAAVAAGGGAEAAKEAKEAKAAKAAKAEGEAVDRHAGVLGLSAVVEAFPYTLPNFIPAVLATLARRHADPSPVDAAVRKVFSEFKRTHADSWNEDQLKFTQEQVRSVWEECVGGVCGRSVWEG